MDEGRKLELAVEDARREITQSGEDPAAAACNAYSQWIAALERFERARDELPPSEDRIRKMEEAAAEVAAWGAKATAAVDLIESKEVLANVLQLALMTKDRSQ